MNRYLLTHSLLSSWLYAMKNSPYEDATTEKEPYQEFMQVLRREPTETTDAIRNGIEFEDLVTGIVNGDDYDECHKWICAAQKVADMVSGGVLQYKAKTEISVSGILVLLYGRLDVMRAGTVFDIKFSKGYERGKYLGSTQHPVYLRIVPEANKFTYIVSNGTDVWTETYRREETAPIEPIISDFFEFLNCRGLMETYKKYWVAL